MQILKKSLSDPKQDNIETVPINLPITEYNQFCINESAEDDGYIVVCGSGFIEGPVTERTINAVASNGVLLMTNLE